MGLQRYAVVIIMQRIDPERKVTIDGNCMEDHYYGGC